MRTLRTHYRHVATLLLTALFLFAGRVTTASAQDVFASPRPTYSPQPDYPAEAKAAGVQGVVAVQVRIDAKGSVTEAKVVSGNEMLRSGAVQTASSWKFEPTILGGQATAVVSTINLYYGVAPPAPPVRPAAPIASAVPPPNPFSPPFAVPPTVGATLPPPLRGTVATIDGDKEIGSLKWEIREEATGKILASGDRPVRLKDVTIQDIGAVGIAGSRRETPKRINLTDQFTLEMAEFPAANLSDKSGFGMVVRKTDIQSFSFEWFNVSDSKHAVKLQEAGELGIDLKQVGTDWEITRTEFTSDVSLRVIRMGVDPPGSPPYWRVNISKGSNITWPSIVNGTVVPN